ncbi:isochorismate synthase [Sedimenticola selenatireducens]|nr:isochorismate synthase [Sedimenticola selenatireducens]
MANRQSLIKATIARLKQALTHLPHEEVGPFSITLSTPELQLHHLPHLDNNWFYWGEPSHRHYRLGLGEALRLSSIGPLRLQQLSDQFERVRSNWIQIDPDCTGLQASAFTGFAFDPEDPMLQSWEGLPNAAIFLPELLLHQTAEMCAITFSFAHKDLTRATLRSQHLLQKLIDALGANPDPNPVPTRFSRTATTPSDDEWITQVNKATHSIREGTMDKVVPFRRISVQASQPFNPARLMASLDDLHPSSILFSIRVDGSTFAAATPEHLLSRQGHLISCDAIGGTIKRSPNPVDDTNLGKTLINDPKSRHEHALVVKGILGSLKKHCCKLTSPTGPSLKRLRNLQHLWTGIKGELWEDTTLLRVADDLHPTAAVSGFPSANAQRWLDDHKNTTRGWYTGAAGWIDIQGDGELAVLLRCALLNGEHAELFAGAGVTSESCPIAELQETELKFGTMLEALEHA